MTNLERTSEYRTSLAYYEREKEAIQTSLRTALLRYDREAVKSYTARLYFTLAEIKRIESILQVQS